MKPYRDPYCVPGDSGLPDAQEWLAKNGSRAHPVFSFFSRYDDQRVQLTPQKRQEIDVFQSHSDRFLEALEICQRSAKNDLKDVDISKSLSWDDIMAEYGNAFRKYETKAKGWKGLPRKFGRVAGDNTPSVIPFLNFIPEGQYKALFAGLFLIFAAAGRMSNRRQLILATFEGIPTRICDAEKCCEFCPTDDLLQHEVMELYIAILVAIMSMMEWLVETGGWKQIKALCQGPQYGKSLEEKIKDIEKQSASVQRCVDRLVREKIARTESKAEKTVQLATDIKEGTKEIQADTRTIKEDTRDIQTDTRTIREDTRDIHTDTRTIKEDLAVSRTGIALMEASQATFIEQIRKMQKNMETLLQESSRKREWEEKRELAFARLQDQLNILTIDREEAHNRKKGGMILESIQLLEVLAVNHTENAKDLARMLRLGQAADVSCHDRGSFLAQSPKFQKWLTSTSGIFLLVDGNGGSAIERTSAMTFVSALLAQSLSDEGVCCIHYFCGLHDTRTDDLNGPKGLLRTLLAQLVGLYSFHVGFTNNSEYHEFQRYDTTRLCYMFSDLVKDLPEGFVLVCIIDGVSLYETSEWAEDLRRILETLNSLTRDPNVYAVFKVLATSAMTSRQAVKYIPREGHLILPSDAGDGANGPLTPRHLTMQARRPMSSRARDLSPDSLHSIFPETIDDDEGFVDGIFDDE